MDALKGQSEELCWEPEMVSAMEPWMVIETVPWMENETGLC